MTQHNGQPKVT